KMHLRWLKMLGKAYAGFAPGIRYEGAAASSAQKSDGEAAKIDRGLVVSRKELQLSGKFYRYWEQAMRHSVTRNGIETSRLYPSPIHSCVRCSPHLSVLALLVFV